MSLVVQLPRLLHTYKIMESAARSLHILSKILLWISSISSANAGYLWVGHEHFLLHASDSSFTVILLFQQFCSWTGVVKQCKMTFVSHIIYFLCEPCIVVCLNMPVYWFLFMELCTVGEVWCIDWARGFMVQDLFPAWQEIFLFTRMSHPVSILLDGQHSFPTCKAEWARSWPVTFI